MNELSDRDTGGRITFRRDRSLGAVQAAIFVVVLGLIAFGFAGYVAWLKGFSPWLAASVLLVIFGVGLLVRGGRRIADFAGASRRITGIVEGVVDASTISQGAAHRDVPTGSSVDIGEGDGWHTLSMRVRADQISVLYRFDVEREVLARLSRGDEITVSCSPMFRAIRWIRIESHPGEDGGERIRVSGQSRRRVADKPIVDTGLQSRAEAVDDSQWRRPAADR